MTSGSAKRPMAPERRPSDEYNDSMIQAFQQRTPEKYSTHLLPHLKPNFRILDIGCGPGSISIGLAKLVPQGHVTGLDLSPVSLKEARKAAAAAQVHNIHFVQGDVTELPSIFENRQGEFDVIHMHQALLYFTSAVQRLKEMRELLKDGGILSSRDCFYQCWYPDDEVFYQGRETLMKMIRLKGGIPEAGCCSHEWLHQAGWPWDKIQYGPVAWDWHTKEERAFFKAGALGAFRKVAIDGGFATEEEMNARDKVWEAWVQNEAARTIGLDGWVLAWK